MNYTLKTFMHNAEEGFIEGIYSYIIFYLLLLYWIYSTERILNQSILLESTPFQIIMITGCYAILVTSALLVIYYNTNERVINWLKNVVKK